MLLSFRGYLGEIESEKDKLRIFRILFFSVNVQCCVRVSAAKFQVLTRNSGGARAFGNIVRFLADPAHIFLQKNKPRHGGIRTPGSTLVAFELNQYA